MILNKVRHKLFVIAALLICSFTASFAQFPMMHVNRDSLNRLTDEDYADMVRQLGINEPRPGRDPNNPASNRLPNYDELIANPYLYYPDPFTTFDGKKIRTAKQWNKIRRPELIEYFEREVYGRVPADVPAVEWKVLSEEKIDMDGIACINRVLSGVVDNSACPSIKVNIEASVVYPEGAVNVPVIVEFGFMAGRPTPKAMSFGPTPPDPAESWQMLVVSRGWAAATIVTGSIQSDGGHGLRRGIIGLCNKGGFRKPDDWGALRAWAWGASKLLDYFEEREEFDATKVAIEGVSRNGKAALVTMVFDQRFAAGFIASSGKGGANGWRRFCGESLENLTGAGEYHWMAGNFIKYGVDPLTANDLLVDQHEFIGMCAPRLCLISSGIFDIDKWQDIMGMFMMTHKASAIYELLGAKGIDTDMVPGVDVGLLDGQLTYRQHHGGHEAGPNWPIFLDLFQREVVGKKQ